MAGGLTFTVYTELPSTNKLIRMHWAERARLKAALSVEIMIDLLNQLNAPIEKRKVKRLVTVTMYRRTRRLDDDNAYGAVKPLVDAMREIGILYNDSKRWLDLIIKQELDHKNPRTIVVVEEV